MTLVDPPRLRLLSVECFERDVVLRLPFRFGVITVTHSTQAVIRASIELTDGRRAEGVAAETLAAKWFEKSPAWSDAQNLDQLRQALEIAIELYRQRGSTTAFGLYADTYRQQLAQGAALDLNPLVASYGPALLDRAILDALGRALGLSFAEMIRGNLPGIVASDLVPDLAGFDLESFLAGLRPGAGIDVRHTVGLVDPIVAADQKPGERVGDGLPETLEEVVGQHRGRWYKLKVGGDVAADLDRLQRIAAVLDRSGLDYRATLDGNEQYDSVEGIAELWRRMGEAPSLARLLRSILFIEQPIKRAVALEKPVATLAAAVPLIVDESDGTLDTFPRALALGYSGVSSKNCKGLYKSILNAARVRKLNAEAGRERCFMSAEDLTTLGGISVQQDLALVSLLGMSHVERNGHHFIDGMSFAPRHEQQSFAAAHPDLYRDNGTTARLKIDGGRLALGSLGCPGFAVAGATDFAALRAMQTVGRARIVPKAEK